MISSARANTMRGTARPRVLAVLRLSAVSYLLGVCTGLASTRRDGARALIASNRERKPGGRRTAARVVAGAISFSSSKYLAGKPDSMLLKPVVLPPGRLRLAT